MIEKARVISIDGDHITLACPDSAACKSCAASFCSTKERRFSARNVHHIDLNPNDEVEVFIHPGKAILAGFMVLIFPLLMFILGFEVAGRFLGFVSEAARAGIGGAALAVGFGAVFLYNRRRGNAQMPSVLRRVSRGARMFTVPSPDSHAATTAGAAGTAGAPQAPHQA
jgi:sigma-E factor negative regulatory protein RseC